LVNEKVPTPTIYHDSTSVVTLVTQGGGVTRTRYLRNGMHLAKKAVDLEHLIIKYCKSDSMITDGFSKPVEGAEFHQFI
jgi:hypothetical protein